MRNKLMILLVAVPVVVMGMFLLLATDLFKKDKEAYVFDGSLTLSQTLSLQTKDLLTVAQNNVKLIAVTFDSISERFGETALSTLEAQEFWQGFSVWKQNAKGKFEKLDELKKQNTSELFKTELSNIVDIARGPEEQNVLLISSPMKVNGSASQYKLWGALDIKKLASAFSKNSMGTTYLVNIKGEIFLKSVEEVHVPFSSSEINQLITPEHTEEAKYFNGVNGEDFLVSYSSVGFGNLYILTVIEKAVAFRAVEILIVKSGLFFVALICLSVLISLMASKKLTGTLESLVAATKEIASGNFNVNVAVGSKDEVGVLADNFNKMAHEVSRLMIENTHKARMAKELETAKLVQETLFPKSSAKVGAINIAGFYEPASECGGDWWHYSEIDGKTYLWIGDVTGHGAGAALITAAAKAASNIVQQIHNVGPAQIMKLMNYAIFETAKGQMLMTFFIACVDKANNRMTYCNASHEMPYLIQKGKSVEESVVLNEANGSRLGENPHSEYTEVNIDLTNGDHLLFFTDGVLDVRSPADKKWGEKKFIKSVSQALQTSQNVEGMVTQVTGDIQKYRKGSALHDDVTFFICEYEPAKGGMNVDVG